jgi:hypothetical protein
MDFPDDTQRHAIVGRTGSGKTQAALWHLSHRNFHLMPWVIYNYKTDRSINEIPRARFIDLEEVPIKPGIYIVQPKPDDVEEVQAHMWAVWQNGHTGVYIDEGYMVGRWNPAFRALLTQGRSKEIPMIVLSQRPVWMDGFVWSESEFIQVFPLQHKKDVLRVQEFVPADLTRKLPPYHSYYFNVASEENKISILKPVPDIDTIYTTFDRRLEPERKVI